VLPAGDQRGVRLLRHLRHHRCGHARRPRQGHGHPGLQGLLRRLQGPGPGRLGRAVGDPDGDRHRAHGRPVPLRREEGELLMVERNRFLSILTHLVLVAGVIVIAFPVYLTFVASTHTAQDVVQVPMPLVPGTHALENYSAVITGAHAGAGTHAPVGRMMTVSLVMALVITFGKIAISLLSAFAIVY